MKKVLSFALVLALILGSFSMVFAAEFKDVKSTDEYSEAVNVLTGLGIVSGYPDGSYRPGQAVTRAEMAALIINALGLPVQGKALTRFSDVPYEHWASGYISYASSLNIINGYPDGTFKPDRTVSYNEALAMIINALGYTPESLVGSWPGAYVNKARGLGLLDTCKKTGDVGADRGDIACFLNDALDCRIGKTNKDGEFVMAVPADTFANRNGAAPYDPDGPGGADPGDPFVVRGNEESFINLKDYQGVYLTATAKDGKIIAINEVLSQFVTGKLDNGKRTLGKYKLDPDVDVAPVGGYPRFKNANPIANGALALTPNVRTFAVKISGNYIKAIYSESEWDLNQGVAKLVTDKFVAQITAKTPKFLDIKFPVDDNDEIDTNQFTLLGVDSLDDIKADQVAYVYYDNADPAKAFIRRIEIGTQVVTGEVAKVSSDDQDITIGDTVYNVADKAGAQDGIDARKPGNKGTFRLDYNGDIFAVKLDEVAAATEYYGVLLRVGKTTSADGLKEGRSVQMFLADGSVKTLAANKDKVDLLAGLTGAFPKEPAAVAPYVVKYQLNSDGEISEIAKVAMAGDPGGDETVTKAGLYDGKIITDDTVIFNIDPLFANPEDPDEYTVVKRTDVLGKEAKQPLNVYEVNGTDGTKIDVLIFVSDELGTVTKTYGKVVDYVKLADGKSTVYALADGKEVSYPSSVGYPTLTGYVNDPLCELVVTDGKFTQTNGFGFTENLQMTTAAASAVNGSFFIDHAAGGDVYTLSSDVVVYINDGGSWSVGELADLNGLTAGWVKLYNAVGGVDVFEIVVYDK